jgi:hypothetical protein
MDISNTCKNYFNGFTEHKEAFDAHKPMDTSTKFKIASYFTIVVPAAVGLLFCAAQFASLVGRVSRKILGLVHQDKKIGNAASVIKPESDSILNEKAKNAAIDIGKEIRDIKHSITDMHQTAKFFIHVKVNNVQRDNVFIVKNSKFDFKSLSSELKVIMDKAAKGMKVKPDIKVTCNAFIKNDDSTFAYIMKNYDSANPGNISETSSDRKSKELMGIWLNGAAKQGVNPLGEQLDKDGDFVIDAATFSVSAR